MKENSLKLKPSQTLISLAIIQYFQIEKTTLDSLLTLADTIETMTDSHTDNAISLELVQTSRPSDSIATDREDSHQLYQHGNTDHIDTSPTRDNLENEDTLDAPLADTQTAEVTIDRGKDREHIERITPETCFLAQ